MRPSDLLLSFPLRWLILTAALVGCLSGSVLAGDSAQTQPDTAALLVRLSGCSGRTAAFSPDDTLLLTSDEHSARVWDLRTSKPVTTPMVLPDDEIRQALWARDSQSVITGGWKHVSVWDARTGKLVRQFGRDTQTDPLCLSPDGKLLVTANGKHGAALWQLSTGRLLREAGQGQLVSAVFSRDGSKLLTLVANDTNTGIFQLVDPNTGRDLIPPIKPIGGAWGQPDISPDGRRLALGGYGSFSIFDLTTRKEVFTSGCTTELHEVSATCTAVRFTPDGSSIIFAPLGAAEGFDAWTGKSLSGESIDAFVPFDTSLDCSPDSKTIVLGGRSAIAGIWDLRTATRRQALFPGQEVYCVAFSHDGKRVATGCYGNKPAANEFTALWTVLH